LYLTDALVDFVEALAARKATPGGGSAAALAGALGVALGEMAALFSIPEEAEGGSGRPSIRRGIERLKSLRESLLPLVEADCEAFERLRAARALPKGGSPAERKERTGGIQAALRGSLEVPLIGARLCVEGLEALDEMAEDLNPNLATDTASAALFLASSFRASWYNVRINLTSLRDGDLREKVEKEGRRLGPWVAKLEKSVLAKAEKAMGA